MNWKKKLIIILKFYKAEIKTVDIVRMTIYRRTTAYYCLQRRKTLQNN